MSDQSKNMIDFGFKILSALIIPMLLWVNSISVQMALVERSQTENTAGLKECKASMTKVELNAQALEQIRDDLERTRLMIEDIRRMLQERRP